MFDFVGSRVYGYKPNFSKLVNVSISEFAGGNFAKLDDQKIQLDFIACIMVIKLISTWLHEIF